MPAESTTSALHLAQVLAGVGGLLSVVVGGGIGSGAGSLGFQSPGIARLASGALFPIGLVLVRANDIICLLAIPMSSRLVVCHHTLQIVVTGAELFTGNAMYLTAALIRRRATVSQLLRNWMVSYVFNYAGAASLAYFGAYLSMVLDQDPWRSYVVAAAAHKVVELDWGVVLLKGVFANWLVGCVAAVRLIDARDRCAWRCSLDWRETRLAASCSACGCRS